MTTQAYPAPKLQTHLYKACQRCGGDLLLDLEIDVLGASSDYVCLQCGRRTPLASLVPDAPVQEHTASAGKAA